MDHRHPLDRAADCVGGAAILASMLGVTPQAVSQWKTHGVPLERCMPIEDLTAGEVTRRELRPHDAEKIWPDLRSARKGKRRAVKV